MRRATQLIVGLVLAWMCGVWVVGCGGSPMAPSSEVQATPVQVGEFPCVPVEADGVVWGCPLAAR